MDQVIRVLVLYFFTVKNLKCKQIIYQIYYKLFGFDSPVLVPSPLTEHGEIIKESSLVLVNYQSYLKPGTFRFLNLIMNFPDRINWDAGDYGKLWTYNLCYFDYLNQRDMNTETAQEILESFLLNYKDISNAAEPYPTSIRIINLLKAKLLRSYDISNDLIYSDGKRLYNNLEFHLLGNHLLENSIALYLAGQYLQLTHWIKKGEKLLNRELSEQIDRDGAHFELSPMYHSLLVFRLLDCIHLMTNMQSSLALQSIHTKVASMVSWLHGITFSNGDIPLVNDSAFGIAPTPLELVSYADKLGISSTRLMDDPENYRLIRKKSYELFIDINEIGPSYQPGHAHADTFNFIVYANNRPFIVDTGTSTYDSGPIRDYERSTAAHNTVEINGMNSSEVWSSFRVARRAHILELEEGEDFIRSMHDGYKRIGTYHKRAWTWDDSTICITDRIKGKFREGIAYFHLHPECEILNLADRSVITDLGTLSFTSNAIDISTFYYAPEFNIRIPSKVIEVSFTHDLKTDIVIP